MGPMILSLCLVAAPQHGPDPARERAPNTTGPVGTDTLPVATDTLPVGTDTLPAGTDTLPAEPTPPPLQASWIVEGATTGVEHGALQIVSAALAPELGAGFTAHVEFLGKWGHDEAVAFPSSQGLSSLDAEDFSGLGEAWLEWGGAPGARVKAGWVDANTEFAASEVAAVFANPSFGLTPTLVFVPSYPTPRPSVNAFVSSFGGPELGVGAYRAVDGDWTAVVQATGAVPNSSSLRWRAGMATCGHIVEGHDGHAEPSTYLIVDWLPGRATAGFVKVARAGLMQHVAAGLTTVLSAPFELRTGLGASMVSEPRGHEMLAELFLTARVTEWLVVQPDLQLRLAPGDAPAAAALFRVVVKR